jgi:hypothetical protein
MRYRDPGRMTRTSRHEWRSDARRRSRRQPAKWDTVDDWRKRDSGVQGVGCWDWGLDVQ